MSFSEAGKLGAIASKLTQTKQKAKRVEEYYKNPNKCPVCNSIIDYKNKSKKKYCSSSCAAKINNLGKCRTKRNKNKLLNCLFCGNKNKFGKTYCSFKCQRNLQWQKTKEKIIQEGKVQSIGQARRFLKEQSNSCVMCGNDSWLGKPILLLCDHINGNSEDWNLENLRLICSNCDATTPFYKSKNKGNGRHYRRQRYKEGKSF